MPLDEPSGVRAVTGGSCLSTAADWQGVAVQAPKARLDSGQGLGDKQRAQPSTGHASGGSQGRTSAGSSQVATDGHGCVCDQCHHSCMRQERVSFKPTILAGKTSCALVHRRLVSVWVTPRAAAWGWDRAYGQAVAAGAAARSQCARARQRQRRPGAAHGQPPRVLTRRRWGWAVAAARPGRCCRRRVLVPVGVPLGRPRPFPWWGMGTPLLQEGRDTCGLSTASPHSPHRASVAEPTPVPSAWQGHGPVGMLGKGIG